MDVVFVVVLKILSLFRQIVEVMFAKTVIKMVEYIVAKLFS